MPFRLTRALLRLNNASLTHLSLKHDVEVIKWTILLSYPLSSTFSIAVVFLFVVTDSGQWIHLPHVKYGLKPSDHEFAHTHGGTYLMEGPTVEEPLYQVREHCSLYEPLR